MTTANALYLWAQGCEDRIEMIRSWRDDVIINIASSGGKTVASTTANGLAVAFVSSSMTLDQWLVTLSEALVMLETGITKKSKSIQIFR